MRRVLLPVCVFMSTAPSLQAAEYTLLATPQTVEWGYYSSAAKPALTVHSGDTVRIQSLSTCGSRKEMMSHGIKAQDIPPYTDPIDKEEPKDTGGGHILTGPVAIFEAEPGDVLEVQRSEEHTSELQSHLNLVCRLLLEKKKKKKITDVVEYKKIIKINE